jgi:hypothetical protein
MLVHRANNTGDMLNSGQRETVDRLISDFLCAQDRRTGPGWSVSVEAVTFQAVQVALGRACRGSHLARSRPYNASLRALLS